MMMAKCHVYGGAALVILQVHFVTIRHMNKKNNPDRAACSSHPPAPVGTSFLFVFDTESESVELRNLRRCANEKVVVLIRMHGGHEGVRA